MRTCAITARRTGPAAAEAETKQARLTLDTDPAGRTDAFNPAELFLTAVAACMRKGIERVGPMLDFSLRGSAAGRHHPPRRRASTARGAGRRRRLTWHRG